MTHHGQAPLPAPERGSLGRELVLHLLGQQADEPVQALAAMLASAYGALVGGNFDAARTVLGAVMAPALDLERAITTLQQASAEAQDAAASLTQATPPALDAALAFNGPQLAAWREALEGHVAAQMELVGRITILQQLAHASAPETLGV